MPRHIYISCEDHERKLPEVKDLCSFLQLHGCVLEWAPLVGWDFYRGVETAIERCDVFVAVVAGGYTGSTWLNHELGYADHLRRGRMHPRPRIFAYSIAGMGLPVCSQHIPVEWLSAAFEKIGDY